MYLNKKKIIGSVILALIVAALYYPALNFDYVWDDTLLFVSKTGLLTEPLTWGLIAEPVLPGTSYFRPLVFLSWYLEFQLWGQDPAISHTIGLVIFYFNTLLVFFLGTALAYHLQFEKRYITGFLSALFYLMHPALIETTVWVSGRFDQFATLFSLSAILIFIQSFSLSEKIKWRQVVAISFCFICGLLSKELGIVIPVLLAIFALALGQQKYVLTNAQLIKKIFYHYRRLWLSMILMLILYMILRTYSMQMIYHAPLGIDYFKNTVIDDFLPLHTLVFYIQQTFVPFSNINILHPFDSWDFESLFSKIKVLIVFVGLLLILFLAFCKKNISAWLVLSAIITIILVLHFIPLGTVGNIGHERFMTLGLAFIALFVGLFPYTHYLNKLNIKKNVQKIVLIFLLVGWFGLSLLTLSSTLPLWKNDYSLWAWTYKLHPETPIARFNYMYGAMKEGLYNKVIEEAHLQIKKNGGLDVSDQLMYASALINTRNEEGLNYFEGAIYALPKFHEMKHPDARKQANYFYISAGQMAGAYASYALGNLLYKDDVSKALEYFRIAEWYMLPDEKELLNYHLAAALYANKQYETARQVYTQQLAKSQTYNSKAFYSTREILSLYCEDKDIDSEVCNKLSKEKIFLSER